MKAVMNDTGILYQELKRKSNSFFFFNLSGDSVIAGTVKVRVGYGLSTAFIRLRYGFHTALIRIR